MAEEFDLIVSGGEIADGSGGALYIADIAIRDGRIAAIGRDLGSEIGRAHV
jgi:N-acyl-D-aspartate/D-glutamate deacylase